MRKYGLPYKGSKSAIAEWVIDHLPPGGTLIDLFCGGCAVTHAALLSDKWSHIVANDIHGDVPQLFLDAINGKYTTQTERRWISREDFFRLKDTDAYVRLCWSFGNDGKTYMYSREIEPIKKQIHISRLSGAKTTRIETIQRLQSLERLERLERLEIFGCDYRDVSIPADAVIYCDIPYDCSSDNYGVSFDRAAFFDWADSQPAPVIISEYNISDDRFTLLAETTKRQLAAGAKHQKRVVERLYVPKRQLDMIKKRLQMQEKMAI